MYYTYVLISKKDDKRYIGSTANLEARLKKHNAGSVRSTKYRRPLELIYYEEFETKVEAEKREKFFKSKVGFFELNKILLRGRAAR